jgi:hypothetical protein
MSQRISLVHLIKKNNNEKDQNRAGGVMVQQLPSMYKVLGLISSMAKKKLK